MGWLSLKDNLAIEASKAVSIRFQFSATWSQDFVLFIFYSQNSRILKQSNYGYPHTKKTEQLPA